MIVTLSSCFLHLPFTLPANGTLLLLQQNFARVCVVPQTFFHEPLIRPQSAVRRCHVVLHLVQLHRQLREIVTLLQFRTRAHAHAHTGTSLPHAEEHAIGDLTDQLTRSVPYFLWLWQKSVYQSVRCHTGTHCIPRPVASAVSVIGRETRPVLILATGLGFATRPWSNWPLLIFWHSGTLALSPERQSARVSKKIK